MTLANLLVSPLIGWTQEKLLAGALREGGSLWRHLRQTGSDAVEPLSRILRRADFAMPPGIAHLTVCNDACPAQGTARLLAALQPDRAAR